MFTIRHTYDKGWEVLRDGKPWTLCYLDEWDDALWVLAAWHPAAVAPMLAALKCEVCSSTREVLPEQVGSTFMLCCKKCRAVPSTATAGPDHLGKKNKKPHVVHEVSRFEWLEATRKELRRFNLKSTGVASLDKAMRLPHAPLYEKYPMKPVVAADDAPTACQGCDCAITEEYVDGVVAHAGWGYLCPACHKAMGIGLGVGRGRLYRRLHDGSYVAVALPEAPCSTRPGPSAGGATGSPDSATTIQTQTATETP